MSQLEALSFEMPRRPVRFFSQTILPNGLPMNYTKNPNDAVVGESDGDTLVYNSPIGTWFQMDNGEYWYKKELPNTWVDISEGGGEQVQSDWYEKDETEKSFIKNKPNKTTLIDVDGNKYKTLRIGNQLWTIENFRCTKYNDGTPIPHITDDTEWGETNDGAYCFYDNTMDDELQKRRGALYNFFAYDPENPKKIAPEGWRVPNTEDWLTLFNFLTSAGYNWDGSIPSKPYLASDRKIMKALADIKAWNTSATAGAVGNNIKLNNSSGFSILPVGTRSGWDSPATETGEFTGLGTVIFLAVGENVTGTTTILTIDNTIVTTSDFFFFPIIPIGRNGVSIRLVRDIEVDSPFSYSADFDTSDWEDSVDIKYLDITHNLNVSNPKVEVYEGTDRVFPQTISIINNNKLRLIVPYGDEFSGSIRIIR